MKFRFCYLYCRVALSSMLFALVACSGSPPPPSAATVPVQVAPVLKKALPELVAAVGSVEAINSVAVKSLVDGQILETRIKDGQDVKQGQLLFRIDPRPAQAALAQAQASLVKDEASRDLAQAQVTRYRPVAVKGYISADQMQQYLAAAAAAAASVNVDRANVDAARLTVGYTDIHAPIDGRAGRILVQAGNLVKANDTQALLTINQLAPIFVAFAVPGQYVDRVRAAQAQTALAVVVSGSGIGAAIQGTLAFVDNAVDPATNTIKLRARFANTDERLWPGQFVNVTLTLGSDANALVVPDVAVEDGPDGNYVFVIGADGRAQQREVSVARSVNGESMIAKGLSAGETVVTDGQSRLSDGARVHIVPTSH